MNARSLLYRPTRKPFIIAIRTSLKQFIYTYYSTVDKRNHGKLLPTASLHFALATEPIQRSASNIQPMKPLWQAPIFSSETTCIEHS